MAPAFSAENLTCIRGDRMVFAGLGFAVEAGDALTLVGPNGSGKSSLLRLLAGLGQPAVGIIRRGGIDVREDPAAHFADQHYIGHGDAAKPVLSVAENLAFWADGAETRSALEELGLGRLGDLPARFLSAGQRRRLALARLRARPATLWLLDAPSVALDRDAAAILAALIARHREAGGIVLAATHLDLGIEGAATLDLSDFRAETGP